VRYWRKFVIWVYFLSSFRQVCKWGINTSVFIQQDSIIAGDLNADRPYIARCSRKNLLLKTDPRFLWITSDDDYTNVLGLNKAYDRYVERGLIGDCVIGDSVFCWSVPFCVLRKNDIELDVEKINKILCRWIIKKRVNIECCNFFNYVKILNAWFLTSDYTQLHWKLSC